ncbi:uncharacterized protein LOC132745057 [Ruditapes philippinarum]|uniref:uncharacterized protein LOC132745057 n=1 Tax=Ruditapes philippinarum TaxID=129788 RepID=UPI00295B01B3|nr:uncharacterized protein LOC132745057 [Ruditapes philippinarum]
METTSCNNTWKKEDMNEGQYTLKIVATDLEGNKATESHTWVVDTTPPVLIIENKPDEYSNEHIATFKWQCMEPCTTVCLVSYIANTYPVVCSSSTLYWTVRANTSKIIYRLTITAFDEVYNSNETHVTWISDFEDPKIQLCEHGQNLTVDCSAGDLKPESICNASVSDDLDTSPHLNYTDESIHSCDIRRIWTAVDRAGNKATNLQTIHIKSESNIKVVRSPGPLLIACGALENMTDVIESMFDVQHPCGMPVKFSFTDEPPNNGQCDSKINRTWTIYDDCGRKVTVYQPLRIRQARKPLSPGDGQTGIDLNIYLRWQSSPSVSNYTIYIWKRGAERSKEAIFTSIESFYESPILEPGTRYNWQIVYNYINNDLLFSPIWSFETRQFVDVAVTNVTIPPLAYTGDSREVKWTVINNGRLTLLYTYWTDGIYLSWDNNFQNAKLVASVRNTNILYPNDGYSSSALFTFDEKTTGNAYIFVYTDMYMTITEHNKSNNVMRSLSTITVKLTPPPDLQVTSINFPGARVFSGSNVKLTWDVVNTGEGPTKSSTWWDRIWWSETEFTGYGTSYLTDSRHNGNIVQNGNYSQAMFVKIPDFISGNFYIIIETDVFNNVFEHLGEKNNLIAKKIQVLLTPPPDLEVTLINMTNKWITGETVDISWTVRNNGNDSPVSQSYWRDLVGLVSKSGHWRRNVATMWHYGALQADESYTSLINFYVSPDISSGNYDIFVFTDFTNNLFEYANDKNNNLSQIIYIKQALPDLEIVNFTASVIYEANFTLLNAAWKVRNIGNGNTLSNKWIDSLKVKSQSYFSFITLHKVLINTGNRFQRLQMYERNVSVVLPFNIYGNIKTRLEVDNEIYSTGDKLMHNNIATIENIDVELRAADLLLLNEIELNQYILAGKSLQLTYRVSNKGNRKVEKEAWMDRVFIAKGVEDKMPDRRLDHLLFQKHSLSINGSYSQSVLFTIPKDSSGPHYVIINVNIRNDIFEGINTLNNRLEKLINIEPAPASDLSIIKLEKNVSFISNVGTVIDVKWKVKNVGNSFSDFVPWYDQISYKTRNGERIPLNSYTIEYFLEYQASYEQSKRFFFPSDVFGRFFLCIETDVYSNVYEAHSRHNNLLCQTSSFEIKKVDPALLDAQLTIRLPDTDSEIILPGSNVEINVTVTNIGLQPTHKTSWVDSVFLADHEVKSVYDLEQFGLHLHDRLHIGMLLPSQSYSFRTTITIPGDFSGHPFLLVLPDSIGESEFENSVVRPFDKNSTTINMTNSLTPIFGSFLFPRNISLLLPNLEIDSDIAYNELHGGQPVLLGYNVTNTGNVTSNHIWYDSVYLSEDFVVDSFDRKLKSIQRNFNLKPGDTKSLNVTIFLPKDLQSKSYFLAIVCDSNDDLFEENEDDNIHRIMFDLIESVSSDILVAQVRTSSVLEYGNDMTVLWEIYNNGTNKVDGYKCDSVYLSDDETWDITDSKIGEPVCSFFSLSAKLSNHLNFSLQGEVPHVIGKNYSTLVKSRTNVIDIHLENNVGVSINKTRIAYQSLSVGNSTNMILNENNLRSLQIVNVSSDATLILKLTSNNTNAFNNIFLKSVEPATLYDFDFATDKPNLPNQYIIVPDTLKSDYYILLQNTGFLNPVLNMEQNVSILVKYANFEIQEVFPKVIIPGVQTTFVIKGTLFPFDMQIKLNNINVTVMARAVYIFSTTVVYASFDIPNDINSCNLTIFSPSLNQTIIHNEVINVRYGKEGYLYLDVESTERVLNGKTGKIKVNLANLGDSDMVVPIIKIEASGAGIIKLDDASEDFFKDTFYVFGCPDQGPAGILLSRAMSSLTFKSIQNDNTFDGSESMKFSVSELVQSTQIENPFLDMKYDLKPSHYNVEEWTPVWDNFIALTGNNTKSLALKMSDVLNEMSLAGRYVKNFDAILKYLIEFSDAPYGDRNIQTVTDFDIQSNSNVRLVIERFMSARIGSRKQSGYMGSGWILPLWDTKIRSINRTELILTLEKVNFLFVKVDDNVYINKKLGILTENATEFILRSDKDSKEFRFDSESLRIKAIASLTDSSRLNFEYKDLLLTVIRHSDGPYVSVRYNVNKQIQYMQLHESTSGSVSQVRYVYDYDTQMLSQTISELGTTRYYYKDNALSYVMYEDRSMFLFQYNDMGHLKSRSFIVNNKKVSELVYSYSNGGMISVHNSIENETYRLTFSEEGDVIQILRDGYLPDRTVFTKTTETNYEGDTIVTKRKYENNGRHIVIEDGNGDKIKTIFNGKNQLTAFIDGRGNRYDIVLNENGTLSNISFPDGTTRTYRYAHNGHTTTTQSGGTKRYEYNDKKQLQMKDIGNNSVTTFEYDETGQLTRAVSKHGMIRIRYENSKIKSVIYPENSIDYEYTDKKQVSRITTNRGYVVKYKYNGNGQLSEIADNKSIILRAEYNSKGRIIRRQLGNNASTNYEYDPISGLLKKMSNHYPNGTIASFFNYTYSTRKRRVAVDTLDGKWKFNYDRAGQVVTMTDPRGHVTEYTYDSTKNRKIVSINGAESFSTINEMNQYTKYRDKILKYDKNGNVIQRKGPLSENYTFDEENKIVSYKSNSGQCNFEYDALGNLFMKECNGHAMEFVINPTGNNDMDILEKIEKSGGKENVTQFYYGGDQIGLVASRNHNDNLVYYMYDPLGSVTNILDDFGNLLNSYERNPFGEIISSEEKIKSMFTFIGQWGVVDFEEMTDIYLMRTRLYDSYSGRFMSTDPLGLKAHSKNLYAYCSNNPVHFNDPRGTCPLCWSIGIGAGKSLLEYALTHKTLTWGGAAGAIIEGGLNGALSPLRKFLPSPVMALLQGGVHVLSSLSQHTIDGEPYSFKDATSEFGDYVAKQTALGKMLDNADKVNKIIDNGCSKLEKYFEIIQKACGSKRGLDRKVKQLADGITKWVRSFDPNDIIGPAGYGQARFIQKTQTMEYTIRFENNENATAPAQRVYIEHKYNKHLDARTFTMGNFGFGNFERKLPPKSKLFQGTLDRTADLGILIRVFAGLDLKGEMVIWEFESIDKATGEPPSDPTVGFLPPNNGTSGQGYVTFTMKPKQDTPHLSIIHANASIYFDQNEPIDTPNIANTIDDTIPDVKGSIIAGTETIDSVTISLIASDTGSGVKHVDLFEVLEQGLKLYRGGISENHCLIHLELGKSKHLLPIAVDHVGNHENNINTSSENTIHAKSNIKFGTCDCSGNGNCSRRTNICICESGYYGSSCNSTIPPPEPPLLELKSEAGFTNEPIELTISARNLSGSLEDIEIFVSGMTNGTTFSKGRVENDSSVLLSSSDFGLIHITTGNPGEQTLRIKVIQQTKENNFTRIGELPVMVYPEVTNISIEFEGCFTKDHAEQVVVTLNSSVDILTSEEQSIIQNKSTLIPYTVSLALPSWVRPLETFESDNVYRIEETVTGYVLKLIGRFEPFMITYHVKIEPDGVPSLVFSKTFQISSFCHGDCEDRKYGLMCDKTCDCDWNNAIECNQFNGSCSCSREWKGFTCNEFACPCIVNNTALCDPVNKTCQCQEEWEGESCDIDVNECLNSSSCETVNNTGCQNKDWGFDCLCLVGYDLQNGSCIEINETINSTMLEDNADKRITPITLHLDIVLPPNVNLKVAESYKTYAKKATDMLKHYYKEKLRDNFVQVIINSIRRGSVIVDHSVITKDTDEGSQELAIAVYDMKTGNASLDFDGKAVHVTDIIVDNKKVPVDICTLYTSFNPCNVTGCVTIEGKPSCRVLDPPANLAALIISLAVGIPVAFIFIVVVTVFCCLKKEKKPHIRRTIDYDIKIPRASLISKTHQESHFRYRNPIYDGTYDEMSPMH